MTEKFDQREFIRIPDSSEITYGAASLGKKKKSKIKDISQAGIRFISEEKLEPGAIVDITLNLERVEFSFTAKASVCWVHEIIKNKRYEVGVKFVDLPDSDVTRLLDYIHSVKRLDSFH